MVFQILNHKVKKHCHLRRWLVSSLQSAYKPQPACNLFHMTFASLPSRSMRKTQKNTLQIAGMLTQGGYQSQLCWSSEGAVARQWAEMTSRGQFLAQMGQSLSP